MIEVGSNNGGRLRSSRGPRGFDAKQFISQVRDLGIGRNFGPGPPEYVQGSAMINSIVCREIVMRGKLSVALEGDPKELIIEVHENFDRLSASGSNGASHFFAEYSLSDTGSYQSIPPNDTASWTMKLPSSAPCQ